jgi:hypothetical protein
MSVCAVVSGGDGDAAAQRAWCVGPPASLLTSPKHGLPSFSVKAFTEPGVAVVYGPPKSGVSTLLESLLLEIQAVWGLDGVVILTDRATDTYMGNTMPNQLITDKAFPFVLRTLIDMQRHRRSTLAHEPTHRPYRLALAVDDHMTDPKDWRAPNLQRDLRLAADANIMVLIGTSNTRLLSGVVQLIATHVFVTRAVTEAKLMAKTMFATCITDESIELEALLRDTAKYEFLVGCLRADRQLLRAYTSTKYVRDARVQRDTVRAAWRGDAGGAAGGYDAAETADGGSVDTEDNASYAGSDASRDDSGTVCTPPPAGTKVARFAMDPELIVYLTQILGQVGTYS